MLYVFSVDIGVMYTFEVELAMESLVLNWFMCDHPTRISKAGYCVQTLMSTVATVTGIPVDKQVLLITGGEALDPSDRVCNYSNAGTDTSPIYLFSKSTIESSAPPSPSLTFGSEANLKEQVEVSFKLPPTYETLVSRAQLASDFNHYAVEIARNCETLISEQSFQQQGWGAVVANLDNIAKEFSDRATVVQQSYKEFLESRARYLELLNGYDEILQMLAEIPVLPCLLSSQHADRQEFRDGVSLLEWISAQDHKNSLQDIVTQCTTAIEQFDESVLEGVMNKVFEVQEALDNTNMKEIKGLDERLMHLQQFLQKVQELMQSQSDMAQGFIQNQTRAQNIGDASVLPDLCASHQKQLMMLLKNHSQLRDYLRRSAKAKEELSVNLHLRLRWIMHIEKKVCDTDSTLIMYHENIRRIKRRLDILDQVSEAPKMYIIATAEVVRRRKFSSQFLRWAKKLHENVAQIQAEESARREEFALQFGRHFLQTLFTGMDDRPTKFADKPPKSFDRQLPIITDHDLEHLQSLVPKFKEYLEESPISMSIGEDFSEANSLSLMFKLQESQMVSSQSSQKEMSASKAFMSVDASTQAVWMDGGGIVIEESKDSPEDDKSSRIGLSSSQTSTDESVPLNIQSIDDGPPKCHQKDSDTGSEPSSGLTDSDIMFKSAQEDYVTVEGADLDAKDHNYSQNEPPHQSITGEHDSSQTLTLTSSGSQSITASTQTDLSLEENLICSGGEDVEKSSTDSLYSKEAVLKLEERVKELENELKNNSDRLDAAVQRNVRLEELKNNLTEFLQNVVSLRGELRISKEMISECKGTMDTEVQLACSKVQEFAAEVLNRVSTFESDRTKQQMDQIIQQLTGKYESEKSELLNTKAKLELKINNLSMELQKVQEEWNITKNKNAEEIQRLMTELGDYKGQFEEQQNMLMKLKENKGQSEEEQQTRFNAIIMRLKKEKDQIVGQLNEKMKEMQRENEKQKLELTELQQGHDSVLKDKELLLLNFQEKEKEYASSMSTLEEKLQQIQSLMEIQEKEFEVKLEKEKSGTLMLLEMERQMWEDEKNNQDVEMKDGSSSSGSSSRKLSYVEKLEQLQKSLVDKDEQIKALKKQMLSPSASDPLKSEKVALKDFQIGDLILLVFDPRYESYLVFSTGTTLYFLHPDSLVVLDIATSGVKRRDWVLAQLTDKEYCQAKKAHNRFHVPVGTKFYRIQAKQLER